MSKIPPKINKAKKLNEKKSEINLSTSIRPGAVLAGSSLGTKRHIIGDKKSKQLILKESLKQCSDYGKMKKTFTSLPQRNGIFKANSINKPIPNKLILKSSISKSLLNINNATLNPTSNAQSKIKENKEEEIIIPETSLISTDDKNSPSKFSKRKSVSQIDFKSACRNGNVKSKSQLTKNCEALVPVGCRGLYSGKTDAINPYNEQFFYVLNAHNMKMNYIKFYCDEMSKAWHERRDMVKLLKQKLQDCNKQYIKCSNQLHVYKSLYYLTKTHNDDANKKVQHLNDTLHKTRLTNNTLTSAIKDLNLLKNTFEDKFFIKENEYNALNTEFGKLRAELVEVMASEGILKSQLANEHCRSKALELSNANILTLVSNLSDQIILQEETYKLEISTKEDELENAYMTIESMKSEIKQLTWKVQDYDVMEMSEAKLQMDRVQLEKEIAELRLCLRKSSWNRMKVMWRSATQYQNVTFQMLHLIAYFMLPAIPPPTIGAFPIRLSWEKAWKVIKS